MGLNGADAIYNLGIVTLCIGASEKGIILIKKAIRLNPIPPPSYYQFLGMAYFNAEHHEKAIETLNKSISIDPETLSPYITLTACYISTKELEKAQKTSKKVLEIDPNFSIEYHKNIMPWKDQKQLEKYIENLRKAGLPE